MSKYKFVKRKDDENDVVKIYSSIAKIFIVCGIAWLILTGFISLMPQDYEKYNIPLFFTIMVGVGLALIALGVVQFILLKRNCRWYINLIKKDMNLYFKIIGANYTPGTNRDAFVVEENTFYRVLSGICVAASFLFLGLCISVTNLFGSIFFGALLIASIVKLGTDLCNKIEVSKNEIVIHKFLRRAKTITRENIWVYSEDKLLFKYRRSFKNSLLLESIVGKLKDKE